MELLHLENLTNNMVKFMELLFVVLTLYLTTCGEGGGGGDVPLPVTGRVGETVTLTLTRPIDRVTWMFNVNGEIIFLAEFRDQKFIRENEDYFPNRLEGSNSGTTLLIRELRMEDSGTFTAQILVNGKMRHLSYNLTVLDPLPIPKPVIETTVPGNTSDLCHLNCSVPSNSTNLSYSWICRDNGIEELYANGSTITVSLKEKTLNAEFTCRVQNPAHRNSVSVLFKSCDISGPKRGHLLPLIIGMSLLCVILVNIAVYIAVSKAVCCRIRQILKSTKTPEELHYSSIKTCSNGTNNQVNTQKLNGDCTNGDCTATSEKTTYAELLTNKLMNGEV